VAAAGISYFVWLSQYPGQLAPKSSAVRNLEPGGMSMPLLRRYCNGSKIITARHTKERGEYECENSVACNGWGGVMVSLALVQRSSAEVFLASEIQAFIAQRLKVDIASMDAHSHMTDDFGLDLIEITELLTALEERFGVDAESADEPNQIEFVDDLIHYIESAVRMGETQTEPA
jgi:acyl carrier protein